MLATEANDPEYLPRIRKEKNSKASGEHV